MLSLVCPPPAAAQLEAEPKAAVAEPESIEKANAEEKEPVPTKPKETNADVDPFKKGPAFAPPRGPIPCKRDLYFYVQILTFGNISVTEQTFEAYFYLKAAWAEPEIEDKVEEMREKMKAYKGESWPEGLFDPQLDFMNANCRIEITKPSIDIAPWLRTSPFVRRTSQVLIEW